MKDYDLHNFLSFMRYSRHGIRAKEQFLKAYKDVHFSDLLKDFANEITTDRSYSDPIKLDYEIYKNYLDCLTELFCEANDSKYHLTK